MIAACNLCSNIDTLHKSHIIPAFAIKWIKNTSVTGYLRFPDQPNIKAQDGHKDYLLCHKSLFLV